MYIAPRGMNTAAVAPTFTPTGSSITNQEGHIPSGAQSCTKAYCRAQAYSV